MNKPGVYQIQINGLLTDGWSAWLEGLAVRQVADNETILSGELRDQAALLGVLFKIHALNLKIVSVQYSVNSKQ